jgi:hypothetical protein
MTINKKQAHVFRWRLLTGTGLAGAGTDMCSGPGWLSFRRIVDIPFEACVAALESWRLQGHDSELHVGRSRLRGPVKYDRGSGTCRVEVRLARGPLRPLLRMRLDVDCWSSSPPGSTLELIPRGRVRATANYFRAGHLLLDSLTRSLQLERQIQALNLPAGQPSDPARALRGSRDLPQPAALHQ